MLAAIYEMISSFCNKRACQQTLDKNIIAVRLRCLHQSKASKIFQINKVIFHCKTRGSKNEEFLLILKYSHSVYYQIFEILRLVFSFNCYFDHNM